MLLFTHSTCAASLHAKAVFKNKDVETSIVDVDLVDNGEEIKKCLEEMTNQPTIPNIFVAGNHIGRNYDL